MEVICGGNGMRRTWRKGEVVDFAKADAAEQENLGRPRTALEAVDYWQQNGIVFRVETFGMENVETGEVVYEKRPRIVVDNVPMSLLNGAEWGAMRQYESAIIEYLEGGSPEGPRAA
jgi:hypothetical protein